VAFSPLADEMALTGNFPLAGRESWLSDWALVKSGDVASKAADAAADVTRNSRRENLFSFIGTSRFDSSKSHIMTGCQEGMPLFLAQKKGKMGLFLQI
jgi:hypothetical protein